MKQTLAILFTALVIAAAPALAGVVTLDFTGINNTMTAPTSQPVNGSTVMGAETVTIPGVATFTYYPFMVDGSPVEDSSILDGFGVSGYSILDPAQQLLGNLVIDFSQVGVQGLLFHYQFDNPGVAPMVNATFQASGYSTTSSDTLSGFPAVGEFSYGSMTAPSPGTEFTQVALRFDPNQHGATGFTITDMEYNWVPEPASFLLIGGGLLGLGCVKRFRRKA